MNDRLLPRVVEVEAVGQGPVRQDGVGGRDLRLAADEGTLRRSTETLGGVGERPAEVHPRRRKTTPDGVQNEERGLRRDGRRNILQREVSDKARETAGDGGGSTQ